MYAESPDPTAGTYTDPNTNQTTVVFCTKDTAKGSKTKGKCRGACPAFNLLYDGAGNSVTTHPVCDPGDCCNIRYVFTDKSGTCAAKKNGKCHGQCAPLYRSKDDAQKRRNPINGKCEKDACICIYDLKAGAAGKREIPGPEPTEGKLKIYPNPADHSINIGVSELDGSYRLQLVNMLGQIQVSKTIQLSGEETYTLDVANLASGIYYVILKGEEERSGVFVKE
jgi:hypothetical protein